MKAILLTYLIHAFLFSTTGHAFTKLKNGFETITNNYLLPLSTAVAGCALVLTIIIGYFNPEKGKLIASIFGLSILAHVALEVLNIITQSFS